MPVKSEYSFDPADILEHLPGGVLVYRANKETEEILFASKEVIDIFECADFDEFLTHVNGTFKGFVHPEDYERAEEIIWSHIHSSEHHLDYLVYRIITKSGTIKEIDDFGRLVHHPEYGDLFFVFIHDMMHKYEVLYNAITTPQPQETL